MKRRHAGWALAFVVGPALAAVAGVLTARPPEAQSYDEPPPKPTILDKLIPPYPEAQLLAMGGAVHLDGRPRQLGYALTNDSPIKVADRYEAVWRAQGFSVERTRVGAEEWITATTRADSYVRSIAASRQGEQTVIIASVSNFFAEPVALRAELPAACRVAMRTGGDDPGGATEIVQAECDGHPRELVPFFDRALAGAERTLRDDPAGVFLDYRSPARHVVITLADSGTEPPRTRALVTWEEQR